MYLNEESMYQSSSLVVVSYTTMDLSKYQSVQNCKFKEEAIEVQRSVSQCLSLKAKVFLPCTKTGTSEGLFSSFVVEAQFPI